MKKKLLTGTLAMIIIAAGLAVINADNANVAMLFSGQTQKSISREINQSPETLEYNTKKDITEKDFITLLNQKEYYLDEINLYMARFINLSTVYNLTKTEIQKIYSLVSQDYNFAKIMDIFEFLMDTDRPRDMEYLKTVYDCAVDLEVLDGSKNWVEDAYNYLTQYRGGVLNEGQIRYYTEQGIDVQDIYTANIMSRRGTKTIQEILDARILGADWPEIVSMVYPEKNIQQAFAADSDLTDMYIDIVKADITGLTLVEVVENSERADAVIVNRRHSADEKAKQNITEERTQAMLQQAKTKVPELDEQQIKAYLRKGVSIRELEEMRKEAQSLNAAVASYISEEVTVR